MGDQQTLSTLTAMFWSMAQKDYRTVRLPAELVDFVKSFIEANGFLGYTSVAEFFKDAGRDKVQVLNAFAKEGLQEKIAPGKK